MTDTERALLRTIHYFDLFSYPLTPFEAWKWYLTDAARRVSYDEVHTSLAQLEHEGRIERFEGFVFARGRKEIVRERKEKYRIAEKKFSTLLRVVRVLRFLPFIRGIAVCNSLAYANARQSSDLDVVVIAAPNHIWTARFFSAGFLAVLGRRPTAQKTRDQVCLSFFLSGSHIDLSQLLLPNGDPYFAYWLDTLVPIFGDPKHFDALRSANSWYRQQLPNAFGAHGSDRRRVADTGLSRSVRTFLEACVGWMEPVVRRWQQRRFPHELSSAMNRGSNVVANDTMLKFHPNDRRTFFRDRFLTRCVQEGL